VDLHVPREAAVHAVVPQQMRIGLDGAEVVDADHLDVGTAALHDSAEDEPADAPETIDRDAYSHFGSSEKSGFAGSGFSLRIGVRRPGTDSPPAEQCRRRI